MMISRLLIRLAGANPDGFQGIENERVRYERLGAALLVPPILALCFVYLSARNLGAGVALAAVIAVVWAVIIITIDRVLVVTMLRRLPGEQFRFSSIVTLAFRLGLAALVGFGIAFAAKLALFDDTIRQELAAEIRQTTGSAQKPLVAELREVDADIAAARGVAQDEVADARRQLDAAVAVRTAEVQGTGGSRRYGDNGPGFRAAQAAVAHQEESLGAIVAANDARMATLRERRLQAESAIQALRGEIRAKSSADLLARVHALNRILEREPFLWWWAVFIAACMLMLEIVPVAAKWMIVQDSAYALRERRKSADEEETQCVEHEATRAAHEARVAMRKEFIVEKSEWETYDDRERIYTARGFSPTNPRSARKTRRSATAAGTTSDMLVKPTFGDREPPPPA
jgi:hypothetical protein